MQQCHAGATAGGQSAVWLNKGTQGIYIVNLKRNYKMLLLPLFAGRNALTPTEVNLKQIKMRPSNRSHYIKIIWMLHKSCNKSIYSRKQPRVPTDLQLHLLQMYTSWAEHQTPLDFPIPNCKNLLQSGPPVLSWGWDICLSQVQRPSEYLERGFNESEMCHWATSQCTFPAHLR